MTRPGLRRPATRDEAQYAGPGHGLGAAGPRRACPGRGPQAYDRLQGDLCNGVVLFDDGGALLPGGQAVAPATACLVRTAA